MITFTLLQLFYAGLILFIASGISSAIRIFAKKNKVLCYSYLLESCDEKCPIKTFDFSRFGRQDFLPGDHFSLRPNQPDFMNGVTVNRVDPDNYFESGSGDTSFLFKCVKVNQSVVEK